MNPAPTVNTGTHDLPVEVILDETTKKPVKVLLWRPYGDEFKLESDYAYIAGKLKRPISECKFEMQGPRFWHKGRILDSYQMDGVDRATAVKGRALVGTVN